MSVTCFSRDISSESSFSLSPRRFWKEPLWANSPEVIAADMLAQAEHDEMASAILITTSAWLANAVSEQIEEFLKTLQQVCENYYAQ